MASLTQRHCSGHSHSARRPSLSALSLHALPAPAWPALCHSGATCPPRGIQLVCPEGRHQLRRASMVTRSGLDDATRSLKETAALDDLVDQLLAAKNEQELARIVAENIFAIDQKFWLRIATRNDTATDQNERARLKAMADKVMLLVDTVMKRTEQQLADSSRVLQDILTAAADEKGEWYLPLTAEQVAALRASLDRHSDQLNEALLSNAFAWIRKCSEDRFDTMVQLIQKVLQLYAAKQLRKEETSGIEGVVNQVVYAEESDWAPLIRRYAEQGDISEPQFMEALQRRMEGTVLGLQSGSYAQRVQAEYLKEIEARARQVFRELAQSKA